MKAKQNAPARPLSPHMQIYKPQLTSVLSISHRATGVALTGGSLLLVYWLASIAGGEQSYANASSFMGSFFGQLILFLFSLATFYHLCNGIRHLYWDSGRGFDLDAVYLSGRIVVVATVVLTVLTWVVAYAMS